MNGLFSPDSRFMRYMSLLADLMILNLLFLLTSIPIVTIGASKTALYTVCGRLGTQREGSTLRDYFRAFRDNFGPSTKIWLLVLAWGAGTLACVGIFSGMGGWMRYLFIPFAILFVLVTMMESFAFPLLSRFENDWNTTMKNALLLSLGHFPRAIVITVLNLFPLCVLAADLFTFLKAAFLWVILWYAAAAYANTRLLKKVFAPYIEEEEEAL